MPVQVCIETSAIVGCMLAVAVKADVILFAHDVLHVKAPTSVRGAVDMALTVQTRGSTNPAASMLDVLRAGKRYGSVLIITDEEENQTVTADWDEHGEVPRGKRTVRRDANFADVFEHYARTVAPGVQATFVSFLSNVDRPGCMTPQLERRGFRVPVYKLNAQRPDLRRLDGIFAAMGTESGDAFADAVKARAAAIEVRRAAPGDAVAGMADLAVAADEYVMVEDGKE